MDGKRDLISKEIDETEKQMRFEFHKTAMKKAKFIAEINGELGIDIKNNPSKVNIIKKSWFQKLMLKFKAIFTKF